MFRHRNINWEKTYSCHATKPTKKVCSPLCRLCILFSVFSLICGSSPLAFLLPKKDKLAARRFFSLMEDTRIRHLSDLNQVCTFHPIHNSTFDNYWNDRIECDTLLRYMAWPRAQLSWWLEIKKHLVFSWAGAEMGEGKSKQNLITSPAVKPFYNALGNSLIIRQLPTNATTRISVYNSFESIFGMMEIVLQTFRRWPVRSKVQWENILV